MKHNKKNKDISYRKNIFDLVSHFLLQGKKFLKQIKPSKNPLLSIRDILHSATDIDSNAKVILGNCLQFVDKTVEEIIIPRSDILGIKSTASIDEINQELLKTSHTRMLVYEENLDNIIGFIHIKDLYKNTILGKQYKLMEIIRKPITVVPSTKLIKLLSLMQQERTHLAIVADEYGGTSGIVTNENVIEALVGEINDEHDGIKLSKEDYQMLNNTTLIANARLKIDKVEELLQIDLNEYERDCDTIGGIIIAKAGKMPSIGAIIHITDNIKVEILDANTRLLKKIKIQVTPQINE
jgi:magnesium and cobalt transporter